MGSFAQSLLMSEAADCVIMDKVTQDDGEGGVITTYKDGAMFKASITLDDSLEARVAEQSGVKNLYTVITPRAILLRKPDVFRRLSDGKVFAVTSDGDDSKTPKNATLDMRKVSAKEWEA